MGIINPTQSNPGDTIEADDINTPVNQLKNEINGNIESVNIKDGAITTADIADDAVTTDKIADNAVTADKMETQQAWVVPTFTNSWSELGSGFAAVGYMKDSLGFVHLNGLITGGTIGTSAFTLPAGYRPLATQDLGTISNNAVGVVQVASTGTVTVSTGNIAWTSLCGLIFKAEA